MLLKFISIIGNRYAGFVLCLIIVANLIVGSLVMNSHPELYRSFQYLDLSFFFDPVRGEHFWLYALLVFFSLFAVNLLACVVESVIRLMNNKTNRVRSSAALLFHVALITTMAAHLLEGIYATTQRTMINAQGKEIPELGYVQVTSLRNIYHPDDSLKDTEVALNISRPDGSTLSKDISFNNPAIFDNGRRQLVMLRGMTRPVGVVIQDGDNREYRFMPDEPQRIPNGTLVLQGLLKGGGGMPYAQFAWQPENAGPQQFFLALDPSQQESQINLAGVSYRFRETIETPFIIATIRYNPAVPLIMISLVLALIAILLLVSWLRGRDKRMPVATARG